MGGTRTLPLHRAHSPRSFLRFYFAQLEATHPMPWVNRKPKESHQGQLKMYQFHSGQAGETWKGVRDTGDTFYWRWRHQLHNPDGAYPSSKEEKLHQSAFCLKTVPLHIR